MLNAAAMGFSVVFIMIQIPWYYWVNSIVIIDALAFIGGTWLAATIGGQQLAQDTFIAAIVLTVCLRTCRVIYNRRRNHVR